MLALIFRRVAFRLGLASLALMVWSCGSNADSACDDVGACSQGGDNDWQQRCHTEAGSLQSQAQQSGCGPLFDAYYQCAASHYVCNGITASFPGCDSALAELQACLAGAPGESSCRALASATSSCEGDAGTSPAGSPILNPCTLAEQCESRCYLDSVSDPCSPGLTELDAFTRCTQSCPP